MSAIGNCACDTREPHPASECTVPGQPDSEVFLRDVMQLCEALALGLHARPYSPHAVIHREILPVLRAMQSTGSDLCDCGHRIDRHDEETGSCVEWELTPALTPCMCECPLIGGTP